MQAPVMVLGPRYLFEVANQHGPTLLVPDYPLLPLD